AMMRWTWDARRKVPALAQEPTQLLFAACVSPTAKSAAKITSARQATHVEADSIALSPPRGSFL
ncbi:MAG: hypothetical protein ACREA0_28840, partial [bacterium]